MNHGWVVPDVVRTFPGMASHFRINNAVVILAFDQSLSFFILHNERRTIAANQVYESRFLESRVIEPERACGSAPAAEIQIHFRMIERIENYVMRFPILRASDAE